MDMLPELTLRNAEKADLDGIMALETLGFDPAFHESRAVYQQRIETFPQGAIMAVVGGKVAGCFFSEIWRREDAALADSFRLGHDIRERHDPVAGTVLYVASMTLDPALRGGGRGMGFFQACLARVGAAHPALSRAVLLVNEHWTAARRIYAKAGFVEDGRLTGFFRGNDGTAGDGIVMSRPLSARMP
ncbi:hypothetical protein DLREEDagrD3_07350 [Denitratisoma sp. agr-D3]